MKNKYKKYKSTDDDEECRLIEVYSVRCRADFVERL